MRTTMLGVAAVGLLCAGCLSVTPAVPSISVPTLPPVPTVPVVPTLPVVPTVPPGPTLPLDPTPPASEPPMTLPATLPPIATPGGLTGSVVLVLGSGPQAGTYNLIGDPACAYGVIAADTWSAQYGNFNAGDGDVSTVQVTDEPDSTGNGKQRIVSAFIVVGPIFGGTNYSLSLDRFSGSFTREIQDNGTTAVIHIAGKTTESPLGPGNVPIDVTINCPTVNRG